LLTVDAGSVDTEFEVISLVVVDVEVTGARVWSW